MLSKAVLVNPKEIAPVKPVTEPRLPAATLTDST